ncbi:hypothetical protein C8J56DRAFT_817564 [Mycena floridula]|nr:hypothetical protein C8J56DRAFT_817564 [Mycena floridula]
MSNVTVDGDDHSQVHESVKDYDSMPIGIDQSSIQPLAEEVDSRGPSTLSEVMEEVASTTSLPVVQISQSEPSPTSAVNSERPPPSPSRSNMSSREGPPSADERRRQRSNMEVRASNRLSGFFTNLIHRRDYVPPSASRSTLRENSEKPDSASRSSSPQPRATTPPPSLPPPSLQELGLSLSVITSDLSPSHFSTPPSSGAFLAPHYLLLCHAQGLDVLPLVSPPAPQPYALVRRVSFKSVVVMEQRGVLVAIAGRRDGVRVYALEEVKKAVEWRIDVEMRRERERSRRETLKKIAIGAVLDFGERDSQEKPRKASLSSPPPGESSARSKLLRKASYPDMPIPPVPQVPLVPRTPTTRRPKTPPASPAPPSGLPPPYQPAAPSHPETSSLSIPPLTRTRTNSVADMLTTGPMTRRNTETSRIRDPDSKADWVESSEDEAIDIVAAGSSGSQALDERTSVRLSGNLSHPIASPPTVTGHTRTASSSRRGRPANLDLTLSRSNSIVPPEPSPAPTLQTLRHTLSYSPNHDPHPTIAPETAGPDADEDDASGQISLAEALMESRIPDLPPAGSRRAQQPILIVSSHPVATGDDEPASPRTSDTHSSIQPSIPEPTPETTTPTRRRRWSVLIGQSSGPNPISEQTPPLTAPPTRSPHRLSRSHSYRSTQSSATIQAVMPGEIVSSPTSASVPSLPEPSPSISSSRSSRFLPKIFSTAFQTRRTEDRPPSAKSHESEGSKRTNTSTVTAQFPPPKLEYVKLPGTKGALMVKAVETAKKSFLAILCGDNGEKVELFAGTYRTALGLSRTFILPDSPRSLELQLQGDDLVEVFLVFSQNVFGLEPATVRVREVRIGRAERRAARRRAREIRTGDGPANDSETALAEDDTNVNVSIGVSVAVGSTVVATGTGPENVPIAASEQQPNDSTTEVDATGERPGTPTEPGTALAHTEELVAIATAQMGPYTTFQQLTFAPNFPLASIADDYVIPPTYPDFLEYRMEHEPEGGAGNGTDLSQVQFTPPGLPVPTPVLPSRWFYRDPKQVIHGPWKASLMQAWYKDGLLPPDLPVRREEDADYILLKDLRQQSVDPTHPFRTPPPPSPSSNTQDGDKPLLTPISLLAQPRHYGPPALFYSSRGGHSTTIVDARGRSVLKGRFLWSGDEHEEDYKSPSTLTSRMGDVRRLEAFDVKDRSVLVAMRQGGLEAVDLGDALLKPGDESRTALPQFNPLPSNLNRRAPFVWKIGTPVASSTATSATVLASKSRSGYSHHIPKKMSTGAAKSPAGRIEFNGEDIDSRDEVLFLGRKDDVIYICERNHGAFRILRLCPSGTS